MTEEKIIESIYEHDQAIKSVATAIDSLAEEAKATNAKLDSIMVSIGRQEVILEKLAHMEAKTADSFTRVYRNIEAVEKTQTIGCTPLMLLTKEHENLVIRVVDIEKTRTWIVRVIVGALLTGAISALFILARK